MFTGKFKRFYTYIHIYIKSGQFVRLIITYLKGGKVNQKLFSAIVQHAARIRENCFRRTILKLSDRQGEL